MDITIALYIYYSIWHVNASKGSAAHGPPAISHESRRRADTAQAAGALRARRPHGHRPRAHSRAEPAAAVASPEAARRGRRSEEHTSELQSLMRISYAVFCCKKKNHEVNILL